MQQPRKKLGTNLGPAPALAVFTPAVAQASEELDPQPAVPPATTSIEPVDDLDPSAPAAPPVTRPKKSSTQKRVAGTAKVGEPSKRIHGTFALPYQRRTDGAQTRQTTLTVPIDLDDRFESFYRSQRGRYRTRSMLWAAAMEHFLDKNEA